MSIYIRAHGKEIGTIPSTMSHSYACNCSLSDRHRAPFHNSFIWQRWNYLRYIPPAVRPPYVIFDISPIIIVVANNHKNCKHQNRTKWLLNHRNEKKKYLGKICRLHTYLIIRVFKIRIAFHCITSRLFHFSLASMHISIIMITFGILECNNLSRYSYVNNTMCIQCIYTPSDKININKKTPRSLQNAYRRCWWFFFSFLMMHKN